MSNRSLKIFGYIFVVLFGIYLIAGIVFIANVTGKDVMQDWERQYMLAFLFSSIIIFILLSVVGFIIEAKKRKFLKLKVPDRSVMQFIIIGFLIVIFVSVFSWVQSLGFTRANYFYVAWILVLITLISFSKNRVFVNFYCAIMVFEAAIVLSRIFGHFSGLEIVDFVRILEGIYLVWYMVKNYKAIRDLREKV